jgi:pimeloyl-ACP methyl ester carboxylesterase
MTHDTLFIGDIELVHRPSQGGPDVVMLHGIGSNLGSFTHLSRLLPGNWGLLAWNAPGYGASAPLTTTETVAADYAFRVEQLMARLGLDQAILLGHSLGTLMAAETAALFPDRVTGLVLIACAQGYGMPPGQLDAKSAARLDDFARLGATAFAEARAPRLIHAPESKSDLSAEATRAMAAVNPDGYAQAVHMLASGDLKASAVRAACPTLVLTGTEDVITPPAQSRAVHDAMQAATPSQTHAYAEVPGCGHLVHAEDPEAVACHLTAFVAALDRKETAA